MIYVFLAEGFEEIEALTVVDLCRRAGLDLSMVSITDDKTVGGSHGIPVTADMTVGEVSWDKADMLVLPGGMPGTKNLAACDILMKKVEERVGAGKAVAAICAAPALLFGDRGLVEGKRACCYPGMEDHLKGADVSYDNVTVSDNVITSRGLGTAIDFALAIITYLISADKAREIAQAVVYAK